MLLIYRFQSEWCIATNSLHFSFHTFLKNYVKYTNFMESFNMFWYHLKGHTQKKKCITELWVLLFLSLVVNVSQDRHLKIFRTQTASHKPAKLPGILSKTDSKSTATIPLGWKKACNYILCFCLETLLWLRTQRYGQGVSPVPPPPTHTQKH